MSSYTKAAGASLVAGVVRVRVRVRIRVRVAAHGATVDMLMLALCVHSIIGTLLVLASSP